jgi:hypothetical protein
MSNKSDKSWGEKILDENGFAVLSFLMVANGGNTCV